MRRIVRKVVTALVNENGDGIFLHTLIKCTKLQLENAEHFDMLDFEFLDSGYTEPFVHFDNPETLVGGVNLFGLFDWTTARLVVFDKTKSKVQI